MTLLWVNALVAAGSATVWSLWAAKWVRRGVPLLAVLYALASAGSLLLALGFTLVLLAGTPEVSAALARQWAWLALAAPAVARLVELLRDEKRERYASLVMNRVEARADRHDAREGAG